MAKKRANRVEIEAMLVSRVARHRKLKRIELIGVIGPIDRAGYNWDVTTFPDHDSNQFLRGIVKRLQRGYTLIS
jgi:hypothetical protein